MLVRFHGGGVTPSRCWTKKSNRLWSPYGAVAADLPLTPRARRVLDLTRGESRRLGHNYVGTEHLLLAVAAEQDGIGGRVLREHGVDVETARTEVIRALTAYVASTPR